MTLFSSSSDMNNYTILPEEYENQYFYTYIFNLYKKIYLRKIELELKDIKKIKKNRPAPQYERAGFYVFWD